jgi:hypothetical protein
LTVAAHVPEALFTVILEGTVIVGGVTSFTVTVNEQVLIHVPSVAVIVTVVIPLLNVEPEPVPAPLPVVAPEKEYEIVPDDADAE